MTCPRCTGCLIPDHPLAYGTDPAKTTDEGYQVPACHCLNCGLYVDAVILRNRHAQALATVGAA